MSQYCYEDSFDLTNSLKGLWDLQGPQITHFENQWFSRKRLWSLADLTVNAVFTTFWMYNPKEITSLQFYSSTVWGNDTYLILIYLAQYLAQRSCLTINQYYYTKRQYSPPPFSLLPSFQYLLFPTNFKEALTQLCKQPTVLEIS